MRCVDLIAPGAFVSQRDIGADPGRGGRQAGEELGLISRQKPLGESWRCGGQTHPGRHRSRLSVSHVASGALYVRVPAGSSGSLNFNIFWEASICENDIA